MVNGVTSSTSASYDYKSTSASAKEAAVASEATASQNDINGASAVYEPSSAKETSAKGTYTPNADMINKLKQDAELHTQQLQNIVDQLLSKQAGVAYNANSGLKSLYEALEVDDATRLQAQKDIAEDGYWGVDQTSSRIFDFAMALSGGDPDQMEKMKDAFLKGYDKATAAWGDKLPDICKDTYDAVLKKFEDYANEQATAAE